MPGPRADGKPGDLSLPAEAPPIDDDRFCPMGGWVYAGPVRPVGRFVARTELVVRAAPPSAATGWTLGERSGCELRHGARVDIDDHDVYLSGDRYWVFVSPQNVDLANASSI